MNGDVILFSKNRENDGTLGGSSSSQVLWMLMYKQTDRKGIQRLTYRDRLVLLTQGDSLHRRHQSSRCQRLQHLCRGSHRRRVDGKVQSPVSLKRFQSGMNGIALPLQDFGSDHRAGRDRNSPTVKLKEQLLWCCHSSSLYRRGYLVSHLRRLLASRALQTHTPFPPPTLHCCSPTTAKHLEDTHTHTH